MKMGTTGYYVQGTTVILDEKAMKMPDWYMLAALIPETYVISVFCCHTHSVKSYKRSLQIIKMRTKNNASSA